MTLPCTYWYLAERDVKKKVGKVDAQANRKPALNNTTAYAASLPKRKRYVEVEGGTGNFLKPRGW